VKRRLALTAGALVAAVAFSSCSSVETDAVVATANGHKLTESQLQHLVGKESDGATVRNLVTTWVQVAIVTDDGTPVNSTDDLKARITTAQAALNAAAGDQGQVSYEKGLTDADLPYFCLEAIPYDAATVEGQAILDELAAGTAFADAAVKYSTDTTLQKSGGVVTNTSTGDECIAKDSFSPDLAIAMRKAGVGVAVPAIVDLQGTKAIIEIRPYAAIGEGAKTLFNTYGVGLYLQGLYDKAAVTVNPRYGRWDGVHGAVVGLSGS